MTSIKIKFRPFTVNGKEGGLYFQIIHNRVVRQLNTDYKVRTVEWDAESESIVINGNRSNHLLGIQERLAWDVTRLEKVVRSLEMERRHFTADDVITMFHKLTKESSLFTFMHSIIAQLKQLGKVRTSETYTATLNSFMAFRDEQDVPLDGISSDMMLLYEAHLKARGVRMNTISFYMRNLRAVYNRAVEKGLTSQNNPFRHVYTGVDKTVKRAIPVKAIKALKDLDLSMKPSLNFARDMFMFSFYTRGMSFVDMAYLKKTDLQNGILTYRRRKTGQELSIKWEKCMAKIIAKYPENKTGYLLPIIKEKDNGRNSESHQACLNGRVVTDEDETNDRRQYDNALHLVNYRLKELSTMLKLQRPLTMYVARHSWASAAKAKNVPLHPQAPKMVFISSSQRVFAKGFEHLYRRLSVRECARIQTFPDTFRFIYDDVKDGYKMVGNAVPPRLAWYIAIQMKKAFSDIMALNVSEREELHQNSFNTIDIQKIAKENNGAFLDNLKVILNTEAHIIEDGIPVNKSKRVLLGLVKSDNVEHYIEHSAKIYYTGKKFPTTIALNELYYFMPYMKGKGVRDLYFIKIARVGKKSEVHPNCDDNDFRLVFEIEFVKQLFSDYLLIHLNIWRTFTDTTLERLLKLNDIEEIC